MFSLPVTATIQTLSDILLGMLVGTTFLNPESPAWMTIGFVIVAGLRLHSAYKQEKHRVKHKW